MTARTHPIEATGIRGPEEQPAAYKQRSPSKRARELRRRAVMNRRAADTARVERAEAWDDGGRDVYLAGRQDMTRDRLAGEKRQLRRTVYRDLPELEGRPFRKGHAYRGDRS